MRNQTLTQAVAQVRELAWSDFQLRYTRSRLGLLWAVLVPFMTFGVLFTVFTHFAPSNTDPTFVFGLLIGVILWSFFLDATTSSIDNVIGKRALVRNIVFPISNLTLATCIDSLVILSINVSIFLTSLAVNKLLPDTKEILGFAVILFAFFLTTTGISHILAAINIAYRDIQHIWLVVLQLGFFLSPIIYPLSAVSSSFYPWYLFNPIATVVPQSRALLLHNTFNTTTISLFLLAGIAVYLIGYKIADELNPRIREEV